MHFISRKGSKFFDDWITPYGNSWNSKNALQWFLRRFEPDLQSWPIVARKIGVFRQHLKQYFCGGLLQKSWKSPIIQREIIFFGKIEQRKRARPNGLSKTKTLRFERFHDGDVWARWCCFTSSIWIIRIVVQEKRLRTAWFNNYGRHPTL